MRSVIGCVVLVVVGLACSAPGYGQVVVREYSGYQLNRDYVVAGTSEITILRPWDPQIGPYDFDCYNVLTGAPAEIQRITADPYIGPVHVKVTPHEGRPYGATNIKWFNLAVPGVTGRIVEINISGDLSTDGPTAAASAGTLYVGGNLGSYGLNISGHAGDITLNGAGPHTGSITLGGAPPDTYASQLYLGGSMASTAEIFIGPYLTGRVAIMGDSWNIQTRSLLAGSELYVAGDFLGTFNQARYAATVAGTIQVDGDVAYDGCLTCGDIAGAVSVAGSLHGQIGVINWVSGALTIDGDVAATGAVGADSVPGDLILGGNLAGQINIGDGGVTGTVEIAGDMLGSISVDGDIYQGGTLEIAGDMSGGIWIPGDIAQTGTLLIGGPLTSMTGTLDCGDVFGHVEVGSVLTGTITTAALYEDAHFAVAAIGYGGSLEIDGDLAGQVILGAIMDNGYMEVADDVTGRIALAGDLEGRLHLYGDLGDALGEKEGFILVNGSFVEEADVVVVYGQMLGRSCISIDYDGYHEDDSWESGASVSVNGQGYSGNSPAARIYEITCLVGDVNNDGLLNAFDVDPFVLALMNDGADYAAAYPGLAGSRWYHADLNCDGLVNSFDLDPFVLKLTNPSAWYALYSCESQDCAPGRDFLAGAPADAESVAAMFVETLAPDRLAFIISVAEELTDEMAETSRGEFWAEVLRYLQEE